MWLAPAAAALAVAVVIVIAQAGSRLTGTQPADSTPAWAAGVPSYYVTLTYSNPTLGPRGYAMVWGTVSGRRLALVKPPDKGTFTAVTAAAGSHTFVLSARMPAQPARRLPGELRLFRLDVGQPGGQVRLTSLPVQIQPAGAVLTGLALSPDASKLALAVAVGYQSQVRVVDMATGHTRTWRGTTPAGGVTGFGINWVATVSWAADDRTLAYGNVFNVRLLDTKAPGSKLPLDSPSSPSASQGGLRVALTCGPADRERYVGNAKLTAAADLVIAGSGYVTGKSIVATIPRRLWQGGTLSYPCNTKAWRQVANDLRVARYGNLTGGITWVYWSSPDARTLVVVANFGFGGRGLVGVLHGSRFTPLPGTSEIPVAPAPPDVPAAW
jgi:hypothetical protein